jgi:hypothetical protein
VIINFKNGFVGIIQVLFSNFSCVLILKLLDCASGKVTLYGSNSREQLNTCFRGAKRVPSVLAVELFIHLNSDYYHSFLKTSSLEHLFILQWPGEVFPLLSAPMHKDLSLNARSVALINSLPTSILTRRNSSIDLLV